jgi:hypothetical protein
LQHRRVVVDRENRWLRHNTPLSRWSRSARLCAAPCASRENSAAHRLCRAGLLTSSPISSKTFQSGECNSFLTGRSGWAYRPVADLHWGMERGERRRWGRLDTGSSALELPETGVVGIDARAVAPTGQPPWCSSYGAAPRARWSGARARRRRPPHGPASARARPLLPARLAVVE